MRTSLYDVHAAAGATFTDFAGYEMPVHYGSIKQEHFAVRQQAGLFDVGHMSNLWIEGPDAARTIGEVCPFDPTALEVGKAKYTAVLREDGTILDDTIVFRTEDEVFLMIPNAGRNDDVADHLRENGPATVRDATRSTAILALQGPEAPAIARAAGLKPPKRFRVHDDRVAGHPVLACGTGYTGEKGLELCLEAEHAPAVWDALLEAGKDAGLRPAGLGARDTLRLEKGYCLAGNEFAGGRTPLEAGLGWIIDWDHTFLGKDALRAQKGQDHDRLLGLVQEKGVPRPGHDVLRGEDHLGQVTSGTMGPTLGQGIALAYVRRCQEDDAVEVEARGRRNPARIAKPPFV